MGKSDAVAKERDATKRKARALVRAFGIAIEVVPARELPTAKATNRSAHYTVTVKRAHNASQAFAFDYRGTAYENENHVAPATHDVVRAALASPASQKFFTPEEREAFRQMFDPPPETVREPVETQVFPVGDGINPIVSAAES